MRLRALLALALFAAAAMAALPGSAAAAKKKPAKCSATKSTTLAQTKDVRVYSQPKKGDYDQGYACLYKTGKRVLLANTEECMGTDEASDFHIAGTFVAWENTSCGLVEGDTSVIVTDVAKRKVVVRASGAVPATPTSERNNTGVYDLVVNPQGAVAWIGEYSGDTTPAPDDRLQVRKAVPDVSPGGVLVDSGPDIVKTSLALNADGFYWRNGTTPKFATLP